MKKRLEHKLEKLPDGRTNVSVSMPMALAGLEQYESNDMMEDIAVLRRSVTPPQRKIGSARWFLAQMKRCIQNEAFALMFLEAYLTAIRSATFTLQKMYGNNKDFDKWYAKKQEEMRNDSELRLIVDLRNIAEKEGVILDEYRHTIIVRFYISGKTEAETGAPIIQIKGKEVDSILPLLEASLTKISDLIEEAHKLFPVKTGRTPIRGKIEYIREKDDGNWERFDF
jgi:hypothetical protein